MSVGDASTKGVADGESGLFLSPRDMAKIDYLYLHDGVWDGKRILPPSWVPPELAKAISGKSFQLSDNAIHVKTFDREV